MAVEVLTPPVAEPIGLENLKSHLRVDAPDDDALISEIISGARAEVESFTNLTLTTRTLRITLNAFPPGPLCLPVWPVQSIAQVEYTDPAGATQPLAPSEYILVKSAQPRLLAPAYLKTWPVTRAHYDAVRIDVVAGYGTTATDLPQDLVDAVKLIAAHRFEHREDVVVGALAVALPGGARSLMLPHVFVVP
jgi:uncharacterized phiE125 gp8 family phage protein